MIWRILLVWLLSGFVFGFVIWDERRFVRAVLSRIPSERRDEAQRYIEENVNLPGWDLRLTSPILRYNIVQRFGGDTSQWAT